MLYVKLKTKTQKNTKYKVVVTSEMRNGEWETREEPTGNINSAG